MKQYLFISIRMCNVISGSCLPWRTQLTASSTSLEGEIKNLISSPNTLGLESKVSGDPYNSVAAVLISECIFFKKNWAATASVVFWNLWKKPTQPVMHWRNNIKTITILLFQLIKKYKMEIYNIAPYTIWWVAPILASCYRGHLYVQASENHQSSYSAAFYTSGRNHFVSKDALLLLEWRRRLNKKCNLRKEIYPWN